MSCDATTLMREAKCFRCIPAGMQAAVQSYLLASIAGGSMDVDELLNGARCLTSCLPPGLLFEVKTHLLCQIVENLPSPEPPAPTCSSAIVDDWETRQIANGGTASSEHTLNVLCDFANGLIDEGLITVDGTGMPTAASKIKSLICVVPGDTSPATLNAEIVRAITPLITLAGNDPWTNVGPFVAADLTNDGLKANASTKYLRTGCIPATCYASDASGGLSWYTVTAVNLGYAEMGAWQGTNRFSLQAWNNTNYWDCWNTTAGQGRATYASPLFRGFLSGNRTAANLSKCYFANSITGFGTGVTIVTTGGTRPNAQDIWAFCFNNNGLPGSLSGRRDSFFAVHEGLTAGECEALYDLVQLMRIRMGGGAV